MRLEKFERLPGYEQLELSTQIIIKEALQRGIKVDVLDWEDNFIRLQKGNHIEYIKQATKTARDSYISTLIMENKEVTKKILREHHIHVPDGVTVQTQEEALNVQSSFSDRSIVIKPKSTNFGQGVVILNTPYTTTEYKQATQTAFKHDTSIMIETFIPGKEYRILIIGDEVSAILHRIPANVIGNGVQSLKQLVEEKNKDPLRGKGYVTPLETITLGEIEENYLADQNKDFNYVPEKGETVYLRENSNISTGGDSIDYTDAVGDDYKQIALQAAQAVGARICGVDMIIQNIHEPARDDNYSIIELNFNPALHIHRFPYQGDNQLVEKKVLDLLGL